MSTLRAGTSVIFLDAVSMFVEGAVSNDEMHCSSLVGFAFDERGMIGESNHITGSIAPAGHVTLTSLLEKQ